MRLHENCYRKLNTSLPAKLDQMHLFVPDPIRKRSLLRLGFLEIVRTFAFMYGIASTAGSQVADGNVKRSRVAPLIFVGGVLVC